jgi:hypothetical protein
MKFEFNEGNYEGARKFGGALTIIAQGAQEVETLIKHFRLFSDMSNVSVLQARIEALQKKTLSHVIRSDKRPVYEVSSALGDEFTAPYKKWAIDCFGYDGVFPDLDIPRKWDGLLHTNYQARLYTEGEHICFEAFTTAEPWNGKSAQEYAEWLVSDYIAEEFGTRRQEPEFIPTGFGDNMKPNPNYLRRHRATPAASNARLKRAFFTWWLETHANEAQKAIVAGNREIAKGASYMSAFEFERFESHIYHAKTAQDYKSISFAQFAAL